MRLRFELQLCIAYLAIRAAVGTPAIAETLSLARASQAVSGSSAVASL